MRVLFLFVFLLLFVPFVAANDLQIVCKESGGNEVTLPVKVPSENSLHYQISGGKVNEKYTCGEGSSVPF